MLRKIKSIASFSIFLLLCLLLSSCTTNKQIFKNSLINKENLPNNINYTINKIEINNDKSFSKFKNKWQRGQKITIAHFGDSHIQLGWQVGALRDTFQALKGNAGRGMIFPYSIAKTYSQEDYKSSFIGKWKTSNSMHQPPKIPLGISGFVATTEDKKAQVHFNFKESISSTDIDVKIIFKTYGSYNLILSNGVSTQKKIVNASSSSQKVSITLPNLNKNLTLIIEALQENTNFELHGISLENKNSGIVYHNLGVGGATYSALLEQQLFNQQFPMINADLVILDWGTNDLIYKNMVDDGLENIIRQTIRKIRSVNPNVTILLTSVQEANYKGKAIISSAQYSKLVRKIAKEENTLFYDWYAISGKQNSIAYWRSLGFASKDGIHLNQKGYRVRAKLLGDALLKMLN